jgi:hypothetical protein
MLDGSRKMGRVYVGEVAGPDVSRSRNSHFPRPEVDGRRRIELQRDS